MQELLHFGIIYQQILKVNFPNIVGIVKIVIICRYQKKFYQPHSISGSGSFKVLPEKSIDHFNFLTGSPSASCDISLESSSRALFKHVYSCGFLANGFY